MILSDKSIRERCIGDEIIQPMIHPFNSKLIRERNGKKIVSHGLSSYGYDVSLNPGAIVRLKNNCTTKDLDPKQSTPNLWEDVGLHVHEDGSKFFVMRPGDYVLGHTNEYFILPNDILALCVGKSTYARLGLLVNTTPIEPGFEGDVVIELSNPTKQHIRVYVDEGIAQFLFYMGDHPCEVSYADRGGKYQRQRGITHART